MLPNGLPHQSRLHLKRDFKRIIQGGKKYQHRGLVLWADHTRNTGPVRFAVVVSKKLGPAVVRNRTKRILREAFRTFIKTHLVPGVDLIVSPQKSETLSSLHAAQDALKLLCQQAALLSTPIS